MDEGGPAQAGRAKLARPRQVGVGVGVRMSQVPTEGRPRERLAQRGPDALGDRELLALLLRDGTRGSSALDVADVLLVEHGGVTGLATARAEEVARSSGVGPAKAAAVVAAFELARRAAGSPGGHVLTSAAQVVDACRPTLSGRRRERLLVLVCDAANRLQRIEPVSDGTLDRCAVPVREVLNAALRHDGRAFALAHNHPSGDPTPSDADVRATRAIRTAASTVGLRFLTHVVVTADGHATIPT